MKNIYTRLLAGLVFLVCSIFAPAQNSSNYSFATSTTASLTDMSSGTTQLVSAGADDNASVLTNIGFEFWFMGTRYTQFSASSNGFVRLGAAVATTQYALATGAIPLIAALGSDLVVSTSGKVHYKVIGSAPNRVLVVEFKNMTIIYDGVGSAADGTYQVRLYETSSNIELVYGSMNRNSGTGFSSAMNPLWIGFSRNTSNNNYATYVTATSTLTTTGAATSQQYTLNSPITDLTSVADGSRKMFTFSTNAPIAPGGLNFTAITTVSMTLNWTDNSADETGFAIYRSDDGGLTYNFITQVAANSTSSNQTGLFASTNYFWKVFAVREGLSAEVAANQATTATGSITSNGTGGGLWSSPGTWSGGVVPTINDGVTIQDGDVVTIDVAGSAYSLAVGEGSSGILEFETTTARVLTVYSNTTILAGATLRSNLAGTQTGHNLSVGGNLSNNGTLDFSTNAETAGAIITFTGATNNTFGGSGAITDIRQITMNKGTSNANILELNPTNFTVRGTTTDVAAFVVLTNGTIKISGSFTYTGRTFTTAAFSIPASSGVWLNNPNFTIAGQNGSPTLTGLLRISQGIFNIGTATGNSMGFAANSSVIVEGGAINATGKFGVSAAGNIISYNQSGGTITVCTMGNATSNLGSFDLGTSASSVISLSGGTIICQLASTAVTPIDYRNQAGPGITGVTAGILQLGNASSGAAKTYNLRGIVPNLILTNTSANHAATFGTIATYNHHSLNMTINTGNTLNIGTSFFIVTGGLLTNNGTLTGNGAGTRLFWWGVNGVAQTYTGTGVVTPPLTTFDVDNALGVTLDPSVNNNVVTTRINLFSGNITNANKLTLGNGGTTTGTIQIGTPGTPSNAGNFDVAPAFNLGTGGQVLYYLRVTNPRSTGPEINPARIVTNLTMDHDVSSLTLAGGDLTITGTYAQTNGNFNLGSNTVTSGASVAAPGTFTYVAGTLIGKFKRWITAATGNRDFPVGTTSFKRNVSINFTTAPATGGTLTAEWVSTPGGGNGMPLTDGAITVHNTSHDGFWRVAAGDGLSGGNYTGTFTATSITGVNDYTQLVLVKRADAISPWTLDGTPVATTGSNAIPVLSRTAMAGFSDFAVAGGLPLNPLPVTLLSFTAQRDVNVNLIKWSTSQEINSHHFILERSSDGRNYTAITQVPAAGNSSDTRYYSFTDNNPGVGINYYRLLMVDIDNSGKYSAIRIVRNEGIADVAFYPNPVNDVLNVLITADKAGKGNMIITNMNGHVIYKKAINVAKGSNNFYVDMKQFAGGAYLINIEVSDDKVVKKFNKL